MENRPNEKYCRRCWNYILNCDCVFSFRDGQNKFEKEEKDKGEDDQDDEDPDADDPDDPPMDIFDIGGEEPDYPSVITPGNTPAKPPGGRPTRPGLDRLDPNDPNYIPPAWLNNIPGGLGTVPDSPDTPMKPPDFDFNNNQQVGINDPDRPTGGSYAPPKPRPAGGNDPSQATGNQPWSAPGNNRSGTLPPIEAVIRKDFIYIWMRNSDRMRYFLGGEGSKVKTPMPIMGTGHARPWNEDGTPSPEYLNYYTTQFTPWFNALTPEEKTKFDTFCVLEDQGPVWLNYQYGSNDTFTWTDVNGKGRRSKVKPTEHMYKNPDMYFREDGQWGNWAGGPGVSTSYSTRSGNKIGYKRMVSTYENDPGFYMYEWEEDAALVKKMNLTFVPSDSEDSEMSFDPPPPPPSPPPPPPPPPPPVVPLLSFPVAIQSDLIPFASLPYEYLGGPQANTIFAGWIPTLAAGGFQSFTSYLGENNVTGAVRNIIGIPANNGPGVKYGRLGVLCFVPDYTALLTPIFIILKSSGFCTFQCNGDNYSFGPNSDVGERTIAFFPQVGGMSMYDFLFSTPEGVTWEAEVESCNRYFPNGYSHTIRACPDEFTDENGGALAPIQKDEVNYFHDFAIFGTANSAVTFYNEYDRNALPTTLIIPFNVYVGHLGSLVSGFFQRCSDTDRATAISRRAVSWGEFYKWDEDTTLRIPLDYPNGDLQDIRIIRLSEHIFSQDARNSQGNECTYIGEGRLRRIVQAEEPEPDPE